MINKIPFIKKIDTGLLLSAFVIVVIIIVGLREVNKNNSKLSTSPGIIKLNIYTNNANQIQNTIQRIQNYDVSTQGFQGTNRPIQETNTKELLNKSDLKIK